MKPGKRVDVGSRIKPYYSDTKIHFYYQEFNRLQVCEAPPNMTLQLDALDDATTGAITRACGYPGKPISSSYSRYVVQSVIKKTTRIPVAGWLVTVEIQRLQGELDEAR